MNIPESEFELTAERLNCDVAAIKAVAEVESKGEAFDPQGRPTILFERHIFYKYAPKSKRDEWVKKYPNLCNPERGGYGKKSAQYGRLEKARQLDENAALMACSWGKFQIMGFHWKKLGYGSLQDFVRAMQTNEAEHLHAFICYVEDFGLAPALRTHNWKAFARGYNGPDYKANDYDAKLARAHAKFSKPIPAQNPSVAPLVTPTSSEPVASTSSDATSTPDVQAPFFTSAIDKISAPIITAKGKFDQLGVDPSSISRSSFFNIALAKVVGWPALIFGFFTDHWEYILGGAVLVALAYFVFFGAKRNATNRALAFVQDPGASK